MLFHKRRSENRISELQQISRDPGRWADLDREDLAAVAFLAFTRYGGNQDAGEIPLLTQLYRRLVEQLPAEARAWLCMKLIEFIEQQQAGVLSLMPFIQSDPDPRVSSTAVLGYAVLMPLDQGDSLTGPKFLMQMFERQQGDSQTRLGILMGLIALGDDRVLPLIRGRWSAFDRAEDRRLLAAAGSGLVSTLQVEFLVDWLESTSDPSDVGAIAGSLARMPAAAMGGQVMQVRRHFPVYDASPDEQIECLDQWSFPEYLERIQERLRRVAASEAEPKLVPLVIDAWSQADLD